MKPRLKASAFLLGVLAMVAFDFPDGTYTLVGITVVAVLPGVGWMIPKGSSAVSRIVRSRHGPQGLHPR